MTQLVYLVAAFPVGYLAGSVPFAWWIGKAKLGIDIREKGSGNTGATNLARIAGWKVGGVALVLDLLKGFIPALLFSLAAGESAALLAGAGAVIGHTFSFILRGKGGKGVATGAGVFLALAPMSMLHAFLIFAAVGPLATRTISAGALAAALGLALLCWQFESTLLASVATLTALFIFYRHRGNLRRLYDGTESRLWEGLS